jgi:endonuclease G
MRPTLASLAFLLIALPSPGQEIHSKLCLDGCPAGAPATKDLVIRGIYILSSNDRTKFADWAAYRVTADTIGPRRSWKTDPALEDVETLEPDDYTGANAAPHINRGHQVPLASFTGTDHWKKTNLLSNITPRKSNLNQGPWKRLEGKVRELVS